MKQTIFFAIFVCTTTTPTTTSFLTSAPLLPRTVVKSTSQLNSDQQRSINELAAEVGDGALGVVDRLATVINDNSDSLFDITSSMKILEKDMNMLDKATGQRPQLSTLELMLLCTTVVVAGFR